MADVTPLDLDAIRALAEAATPGPWRVGDGGDYFEWEVVIAPHLPTLELSESADGAEDAAFIAAARTAVPALLAEVDRLRGENAQLKGYLNHAGLGPA